MLKWEFQPERRTGSWRSSIDNARADIAELLEDSPSLISQEVGGETVLLDLASERYFGLDEVGARIWQLLEEHESLRAVFEVMCEEYEVEAARLQPDLLAQVGKLVGAGLIAFRSGSSLSSSSGSRSERLDHGVSR